jgi:hypothetical protein
MKDGRPFTASDCVVIVGYKGDMIAPAPGSDAENETPAPDSGGFGLTASGGGTVQHIDYSLPEASAVRLTVYDISGRVVERLVQGSASAGTHTVDWNAAGHPSGIYFYRLEAAGQVATWKAVVVRK